MAEEKKALRIRWARFPELAALCWNFHAPTITLSEALRLYEGNWPLVNRKDMPLHERKFVNWLAGRFGSYLHV